MSMWYDSQKKPKGDFRKLLQECIEKANICRTELTKDEEKRQEKLEDVDARLKRGEHV